MTKITSKKGYEYASAAFLNLFIDSIAGQIAININIKMKLLIKQRIFSWTDTYDVYAEQGNPKYFVKAEYFSLGHKIHLYNHNGEEVGMIQQKLLTLMPKFEVIIQNRVLGTIEKRFTLFGSKYDVNYNGWHVEGDFLGWDYDIMSGCSSILHISKELLHWGDTYVLHFQNPADEIMGLLLVLAIDAANCNDND